MKEFKMPTDISEKEKIVGGILTAGQLIYFGIGIGIIVGLGLGLNALIGNASFIIGALIGIPFACLFAFYKPHKLTLMTYIKLKMKRRKEVKLLPNHNSDIDDFELDYFEFKRI